jgi:uncharacterized protein YfaS (alpha-2-macroglobulin family)
VKSILIILFLYLSNTPIFLNEVHTLPTNNQYESLWKKVTDSESKALPQSALKEVESIYELAKKEDVAPQIIKSLIYRLKLGAEVNEEEIPFAIEKLKSEINNSNPILQNIYHSMLGELYWNYFLSNRYKFYDRTKINSDEKLDIRTWDLETLVFECKKEYDLSLKNLSKLDNIQIDQFNDIIQIESGRKFRPTLIDFLYHRAIDFYQNSETGLVSPKNKFYIQKETIKDLNNNYTDEHFFSNLDVFLNLKIDEIEKDSFDFNAIYNIQNLLKFRKNELEKAEDKNKNIQLEALIDADLKRLKLVYNKTISKNKDELYLASLKFLQKKYDKSPISSIVSYHIAEYYHKESYQYSKRENDPFKWHSKTAYNLCDKVISDFPNTDGAHNCKSLQSTISKKEFSFQLETINLPNEKFPLLLNYKNIPKIKVMIYHFNKEDIETIRDIHKAHAKKNVYRDFNSLVIDFYSNLTPVNSFSINLKNDGDFYSHSTELIMPDLQLGKYLVFLTNEDELKSENTGVNFQLIQISNLSFITRENQDFREFIITNRKTGEPIDKVRINQWGSKYHSKKERYVSYLVDSFKTNKNGFVEIPLYSNEPNEYYLELIHKQESIIVSNEKLSLYDSYHAIFYQNKKYNYTSENSSMHKTFFFTDRSMYRPGQTVYFKGILIEKNNKDTKIAPNNDILVWLNNPNNQKVSEINLKSNEFGSIQGSFTIPNSGLNGNYSLQSSSFKGIHYISVEEYKRPKFEVQLNPIKGSFQLKENIPVEGIAKSYSGANIDNSIVKYRVKRETIFPRWYSYFYGPINSESQEIEHGETTTDSSGTFKFSFTALPNLTIKEDLNIKFSYFIEVDVTDTNGETRSTSGSIQIGYTDLSLNLISPQTIFLPSNQKIHINSTNFSGEFIEAEIELKIIKLIPPNRNTRPRIWAKPDISTYSKAEWERELNLDEFEDENNIYRWQTGETIHQKSFNTKSQKEISFNEIPNVLEGYYKIEITSNDKNGNRIKDYQIANFINESKPKLDFPSSNFIATKKDTLEPGENAEIFINNSNRGPVLYEIEKRGKIIYSEWIQPNSGEFGLFKINIPISEDYRGNIAIHLTHTFENRIYSTTQNINVPYTNKKLKINFLTFRDKLEPGTNEEWKIKIEGLDGDKVFAELLSTLYDASLDSFTPNYFSFHIYDTFYAKRNWSFNHSFSISNSIFYEKNLNHYFYPVSYSYDRLNWFGFDFGYHGYHRYRVMKKSRSMDRSMTQGAVPVAEESFKIMDDVQPAPQVSSPEKEMKTDDKPTSEKKEPTIRSNFNETAFFYPQLQTDENGSLIIKFKLPDSLTRWKFLGFAHTKDLMYGNTEASLVAQKELMITPNLPRFLRENDEIEMITKINNLSSNNINGNIKLEIFDAINSKDLTNSFTTEKNTKEFKVEKGISSTITWKLKIPEGINAVQYRIIANSENFSDGEENTIPILTNRMLVTETMPLPIREMGTKEFKFQKLIDSKSSNTLRHNNFAIEFTANPGWYAVQALPYLMEYPYECLEQTFSRYYANSLSSHIVNSNPKIKKVFDSWKKIPDSEKGGLISNLDKNQELKSILLEETPWVQNAINETERKKRISLLFDINRMTLEMDKAFQKIQENQMPNGAWPWFKGMMPNRYITQHIITGLGHLDHLGVKEIQKNNTSLDTIKKGLKYLDKAIVEDYTQLKRFTTENKLKIEETKPDYIQIQYLYARSYFMNIPVEDTSKEAFQFYLNQAKKYWTQNNKYAQGMIALILHRNKDNTTPNQILKSLKETAIVSEELGMYWKSKYGYYWYEMPIETQSLMIEVFHEIANDEKVVDDLKTWLLKNKQTTEWNTTKSTANAIYALLLKGSNILENEQLPVIHLGSKKIDPTNDLNIKKTEGAGYFKVSFASNEINSEMGNIKIEKPYKGVSWGGAYWQYFENLDKITRAETPLILNKKIFREENSDKGKILQPITEKDALKIGDLIKVRIELKVDREMEFVHMKDMRASGLEPLNVFSSFKFQDGLGYYESTKDSATNFFFDYLPKGTYIFEYPLRVTHRGNFSNGITTIQSMYAPEFSSHSEGIRLEFK